MFSKHILLLIIFLNFQTHLFTAHAGILPYAWHDNQIWILFGQEAEWIRKLHWQDFGGSLHANEDILVGAAREFSEETRNIWGDSDTILSNAGYTISDLNRNVGDRGSILDYVSDNKKNQIKTMIHEATKKSINYILGRLRDDIDHRITTSYSTYRYTLFFAEVDYIPIERIRNAPKTPSFDKVDYAWVPLKSVQTMLSNSYQKNPQTPSHGVFIPKTYASPHNNKLKVFSRFAQTLLSPEGQHILKRLETEEQQRQEASRMSKIVTSEHLLQELRELEVSLEALLQQIH